MRHLSRGLTNRLEAPETVTECEAGVSDESGDCKIELASQFRRFCVDDMKPIRCNICLSLDLATCQSIEVFGGAKKGENRILSDRFRRLCGRNQEDVTT